MSEPSRIAILIVDDHALFRESIARLLDREADFDVVADVGTVDQALIVLQREPIDIVLLDFDLGKEDGFCFLRRLDELALSVKTLVVTAGLEPDQAAQLVRAGVAGVFLKRDSAELLAQSIRDVVAGRVSFQQELLAQALTEPASPSTSQRTRFSDRERLVLSYVLEGLGNKEIASRIGVTESSVKATLQQLFAKTGVRTRSLLVRIALERHRDEL